MTTLAPASGDLFELRFSATPRGARLARRLASHRLHQWGHRYGSELNDTVALVVGELAANAVTHGLVPGRGASLRMVRLTGVRVRVEVADTRSERWPLVRHGGRPADAESGRGLVLVGVLAEDWGVLPRAGAPGKVVWAEVEGRTG
ncbi:ATP-binding protein [Streptomyces sp. NPDC051784]|uniref:ATP-binding protein n=1 Tax=Streptomyces sp. NPDC051784 TaxID=3155805 RepID=UPI0034337216